MMNLNIQNVLRVIQMTMEKACILYAMMMVLYYSFLMLNIMSSRKPMKVITAKQKATLTGGFLFGGEKGIRTLDTVPRIHDFQSCAFDQLSHLSIAFFGRD